MPEVTGGAGTLQVAANANIRPAEPGEYTITPDEHYTAAILERVRQENERLLREHQAREQGWRPDPNEPDVEIRILRLEAMRATEIQARFRPRTGEPLQECRSVVNDEPLALAQDSDRLLNEHIRMTVDRLCAERRRAEDERQRQQQIFTGNVYYTTTSTLTFGSANANIQYDWQMFAGNAVTLTAGTFTPITTTPATPEQRAKWEAEEKARQAELAAAEKIAERLLLDLIGRHRYRIWRKQGIVHVSSRKYKGLRYEIKAGEMIGLHEHKDGVWRKRRDTLCIHPRDRHPRGDEVATLYALCRFDEETLFKVANHHNRDQEAALELAA